MLKKMLLYTFWILFLSACSTKKENKSIKSNNQKQYKVIAYVHGYQDNWGENFEKAKQITHINYAFANIKEGKVVLEKDKDADDLKKLNALKKVNSDLKILISVGGWSWSKNFSDAALTERSRQIFANSAIDFMLKHQIDGIDLDWEYPGQIGDNNVFRKVDKENFTSILKLIRFKLDSLDSNNKYLLTIASGANQSYLDHTNMKEAQKYLDFINIMTYDFFTGGSKYTGHHANLYNSEFNIKHPKSAEIAVKQHIKAGIPVGKLVLGVPFYGRWWKRVNPKNNGLYQLSTGVTGAYGYNQIADSIKSKTFTSYWDKSASAPYIWRAKDSLFLTYENEQSLKIKSSFVKNNQLGGIMFWQFNGDNSELLNAIDAHLK
ncbi:MAG: glycoside hydrolase family 18 protein [Flavobacteriaceae bacterium]|nr:glycoside hydrolase family 18 protein [Flavobacteriaceae bacterium]